MTDLGLQYLSTYVLSQLKSEPSCIEYLLTTILPRYTRDTEEQKEANRKLILVLKCLNLYPEQSREFLNALASALVECMNKKGEFKLFLGETQDDSIRKCPFVIDVFKRRQSWLESRVEGGAPVFSWRMSQAKIPDYPQIQTFLRSDKLELKYQFDRVGPLRDLIKTYGDNSYEWTNKKGCFSAEMRELPGKVCLIKKTTKMFDHQTAEFNANTQELNNIKKFLVSI